MSSQNRLPAIPNLDTLLQSAPQHAVDPPIVPDDSGPPSLPPLVRSCR